jgi:hypothetical protein
MCCDQAKSKSLRIRAQKIADTFLFLHAGDDIPEEAESQSVVLAFLLVLHGVWLRGRGYLLLHILAGAGGAAGRRVRVASGVGGAGDHGAEAVEEGPKGRPGALAGKGPPPGGVQGRVDRETAAGVGVVQVDLCSTACLTGGWRSVPQVILVPVRKRRGGERR